MENSKSDEDKTHVDKSNGKAGVIPQEQVKGSDADSAYNEDQEFESLKDPLQKGNKGQSKTSSSTK